MWTAQETGIPVGPTCAMVLFPSRGLLEKLSALPQQEQHLRSFSPVPPAGSRPSAQPFCPREGGWVQQWLNFKRSAVQAERKIQTTSSFCQGAQWNSHCQLQNLDAWFEGCCFLTLWPGCRDKSREWKSTVIFRMWGIVVLRHCTSHSTIAPTTFCLYLNYTFFRAEKHFQNCLNIIAFFKGIIFSSSIDYFWGKSVVHFPWFICLYHRDNCICLLGRNAGGSSNLCSFRLWFILVGNNILRYK